MLLVDLIKKDYEWFLEKDYKDYIEAFRPIIDLINIEQLKNPKDKLADKVVISIIKKILDQEIDTASKLNSSGFNNLNDEQEKKIKLLKSYSYAICDYANSLNDYSIGI